MEIKFTFLGTGASMGIPAAPCQCSICLSQNPHNKRLRSSGLLQIGLKNFILDVGPDFRQQALKQGITSVDGVFITHAHFDHVAGLDELRMFAFLQNRPIKIFMSEETWKVLTTFFSYLFNAQPPVFEVIVIDPASGKFNALGEEFLSFNFFQKTTEVSGIRIRDFAYILDIKTYPDEIFDTLAGVETLVLGALGPEESPSHFTIAESMVFATKVNPKMTWLSHISHKVDHAELTQSLPATIQPAYDGMELVIP